MEILDLKREIIELVEPQIERMIQKVKKLESEHIGGENARTDNHPILKRINNKVDYDDFEF